ncbi:RNA-binding component of cleavage and polyadenylation factor [Sporothrix curviconia]|uniref:mRNA 3'-end-processing protein n=1 Tax=Sporothrix curviconia TaxID=1260050 RepID=A0ABP0C6D5_9PEZI
MASVSTGPSGSPIQSTDEPPEDNEFDPVANWNDLNLPPRDAATGVWKHVHENGRRYHYYKYGRYPIPNDDAEQKREDMKHAMMLELTDGQLFYAPIGDSPEKILDIGTGTGIWAVDMGDKFPNAQVLGTDLSPIQPEWLPENVRFMIDDCEADWANGSDWDYVHMRQVVGLITQPDEVIKNIYQHLKPGGWIEIQELHAYPFCDDGTMAEENEEGGGGDEDPVVGFYDLLREALARRGMNHDKARVLRKPLTRAGFTNITLLKKKVPLGPWARDKTQRLIGNYCKSAVLDVLPTVMTRPMDELDLTPVAKEVWAAKVRQSLEDTSIHRHFHFYFWTAQKPLSELSSSQAEVSLPAPTVLALALETKKHHQEIMTSAAIQRSGAATPGTTASNTPAGRLAAGMLVRGAGSAPSHYSFAFTPFLKTTYQHGLSTDRPICKAYSSTGYCPLGSRCPDRHLSAAAAAAAPPPSTSENNNNSSSSSNSNNHSNTKTHGGRDGFSSLVCKHWLRGLCKKGEGCEFLHEYNLRKMPECNFFLRNGYCSNGDECLYLHIDPRSKLPPCPDYDNRGFCALGPTCPKKHVRRKAICPYYLAGFCPDGRTCKEGAHPKWSPVALVAPQVAAEKAAAAAAAAEAALRGETILPDAAAADGGGLPGSPMGGDDYYRTSGDHHHQPGQYDMDGQQQQQQRHMDERGGGDDMHSIAGSDRTSRSGDYRGGFKDRGRGGRWRGRGAGRGFRGRGRGDH